MKMARNGLGRGELRAKVAQSVRLIIVIHSLRFAIRQNAAVFKLILIEGIRNVTYSALVTKTGITVTVESVPSATLP